MSDARKHQTQGPFRADQVRSGDPYELSQGHPVVCAPTGRDGTTPNGLGFAVLDSDPAAKRVGVDTGIALGEKTLRAPDVAVNFEHDGGTWATRAPLVVEYAGRGQDEDELKVKIRQLLEGGTRWVWVMRLTGPRRVEIHEAGAAVRVLNVDETLTAPGVLALPVPVRALFERDVAHEITLRNLLSSKGYSGLEAVRDEGMGPLVHLFERKLARGLTASERAALRDRLATGGPARLGDVVIDLDAAALDAWLKDPSVP